MILRSLPTRPGLSFATLTMSGLTVLAQLPQQVRYPHRRGLVHSAPFSIQHYYPIESSSSWSLIEYERLKAAAKESSGDISIVQDFCKSAFITVQYGLNLPNLATI